MASNNPHTKGETMTSKLSAMVTANLNRWASEAELFFAQCGAKGEKMHREEWANGETMVGPEGARCNQMIPLARAIEIFRAGWKITR